VADFEFAEPEQPLRTAYEPRVRIATFGDGYEQRVADGENPTLRTWRLRFRQVPATIDLIDAFLTVRRGVTSFTWRPPGASADVRVVCSTWNRDDVGGDYAEVQADFREVPA